MLVYLAIVRIVHNDFEVDADLMLITAGTGVIFNIIMGAVLHLGKTEHSHFQQSFTNDVEQVRRIVEEQIFFFFSAR